MKKLVLFVSILFVAISFNSCDNDDDNEIIVVDKIINEWQLDQLFLDGEEQNITACDKQSTIEFTSSGTYTVSEFVEEEEGDECIPIDPFNGTWVNLGNSNYVLRDFVISYYDEELGEIVHLEPIDLPVKVTFSNNTMTIIYTFMVDDVAFEIKEVFIKI